VKLKLKTESMLVSMCGWSHILYQTA